MEWEKSKIANIFDFFFFLFFHNFSFQRGNKETSEHDDVQAEVAQERWNVFIL